MIDVLIAKDGIEVIGHAGAAPPGEDVVCAAISTITFMLVNFIDDIRDKLIESEIETKSGYTKIGYIPKEEYKEIFYAQLEVIKTGFYMVAHCFPQYVTVKNI